MFGRGVTVGRGGEKKSGEDGVFIALRFALLREGIVERDDL